MIRRSDTFQKYSIGDVVLHRAVSVKGEGKMKKCWLNLSAAYVRLLMIFSDCYKGKSIKSCEVFSAAPPEVCVI